MNYEDLIFDKPEKKSMKNFINFRIPQGFNELLDKEILIRGDGNKSELIRRFLNDYLKSNKKYEGVK